MNDAMMNETANAGGETRPGAVREYRPAFVIYHPNAKGTGCALSLDLHPAHDRKDGCIMMNMAPQRTIGSRQGPTPTFPTFDWEHKVTVKLDFADLCKMLQVFRGETETLEDGKGLYHRSPKYSTRIVLRHMLEPLAGYSLEVYRNVPGRDDADTSAHIFLNTWEALGLSISFEDSIGLVCFGIPKVLEHDTSSYEASVREMRRERAA